MGLRTFSEKPKFRVTEKDLLEFNSWIKSKDVVPRLRKNFQSDKDYENFLIDYQERTKEFDAIPKDHPSQELGNNSFIVVKVSSITGEYYYYDVVSELYPWWDLIYKTHVDQTVPKLIDKKFIVTKCTKEVTLNEANDYIQKMAKKSGIRSYSESTGQKEYIVIGLVSEGGSACLERKLIKASNKSEAAEKFKSDFRRADLVNRIYVSDNDGNPNDSEFLEHVRSINKAAERLNQDYQEKYESYHKKSYSEGECPESGCVQKKPNGKWGVISNKTGEFWDADYESEDKAKAALAAYHANKAFSELSDKLFADLTVNNDPSIISKKTSGTNSHAVGDVVLDTQVPTITADWNETKPFNLSVEPWVVANCINDKADGLYIGSLLGDSIDIGNNHISIDIKSGSPQPVEVLVLLKNGKAFIYKRNQLASKSKTFSEGMQYDYRFSIVPTEVSYEMSYVIGSWMMAASVCHLYHICDQKYSGHMALDEFYNDFPEKIDALAEHYLADNEKAEFRVCVVPHECPIDYLTRLVEFTMKYSELNRDKISSPYQSQLDDIVNFTKGILYKLKRLGSGRRIFSILSNDTEG